MATSQGSQRGLRMSSGCSSTALQLSAEGRARRPEERSYYNHLGYANYPTQWYSRVVLGQVPERSRTAVALVSMS